VTIIDTHTHLDAAARSGALPALLGRAREAGVAGMIAVGTDTDDWDLYREIAGAHPGVVHRTVGIHPCAVAAGWEASMARMEPHWAQEPRPVALGECGLDRFHLPKDPAEAAGLFSHQKAAFAAQLALAAKLGCPLVIHSRAAFAECVEMIDASGVDWRKVVFHCFSEGGAEIRQLNERGGRGSFTGILTYKNAEAVRAAARAQGLGSLMIETDAPFLAPAPHRGKPNEPAYLRHTAEYAASMFGIGLDELAAVTTANARAFFGI
jgi:TatD DNase family protein